MTFDLKKILCNIIIFVKVLWKLIFEKCEIRKFIIFVSGAPGAGKTDIMKYICNYFISMFGWLMKISKLTKICDIVSVSSLLKENFSEEIKNGILVEDQAVMKCVEVAIKASDAKFVFVDGFPRTPAQVEKIGEYERNNKYLGCTVLITHVSKEISIERALNRLVCTICGMVYTAGRNSYCPSKEEGFCDVCHNKLTKRADESKIAYRYDLYFNSLYGILDKLKANTVETVFVDATKEKEVILMLFLKNFLKNHLKKLFKTFLKIFE